MDRAVGEVDDGLVVELELVVGGGRTEVVGELGAAVGAREHLRVEALDAIAAVPLRRVHGEIRAAQQLLVRGLGVGEHQADAGANVELPAADVDRRGQGHTYALGDRLGLGGFTDLLEQQGELVPAEPRGGVARAHAALDAPRHGEEQLVTGVVTEPVVDELEPVEIEEQHGQTSAVSRPPSEGVGDTIGEQRPVRQPRVDVMERLMAQARLGGA